MEQLLSLGICAWPYWRMLSGLLCLQMAEGDVISETIGRDTFIIV